MAGQRLEAQDARAGEGEEEGEEMVEVEVAEELGLEVRVAQDVIEESVAASQEEEEKMDVLDSNSCHSGQGDAVAVASDFCDAEQAVEVEVDASAFDFCSGGKEELGGDQAEVHSVEKTEVDEQEHAPGEMEVDSMEEELARTEVDEASSRELCPSTEEPDLGAHAEGDEVSSQQQFGHSGLEQDPREEEEEVEMDMVEEAGMNQGEEAADFVCCQGGALSEEVQVVELAMTEIDEATDRASLHGGTLLQDVTTEAIDEATDRAFFHGVALLEELEVDGLAKTEDIVVASDRVVCDGGALAEEVKVQDLPMPEIDEAAPADLCLTREERQLEEQPAEQLEEVGGDTAEEFGRTEIDDASSPQFCLSGDERPQGDQPEPEGVEVEVDIVGEPARAEVDEATIADVCLGQDDVGMREQPEGIEADIVGGLASTEVDIARLEHALPNEQEGTSVRPCSQDLDNGDRDAAHAEHGVLTVQVTESQAERESGDNAGQAAEAERPQDLEHVGDTFSGREPETGREPLPAVSQVPVAQLPGREPEQESSTNTVVENEDNCTDMDELAEKPEETVQTTWEPDQQVHNVLQEHQESLSATGDAAVTEGNEEETHTPPESETVSIPLHWHPKPCVHISGLGGSVTQEELLPFINQYVPVASMVFENEKRDAVIVRFEIAPEEADEVVTTVREALNSTRFKDKTLVVEAFRPDSLLFIGNLTPEIDDESLRKMFEPHGKIERAFVLRNQEGRSKGYGFVEYSLKSQATAAKQVMGNIDMDGRVLRVEWSDCRKVADMFSTVLFVDRIAKECPNIEDILRTLFGEFGRVRDCHLAIGMSQQFRGFAFIDFNHSTYADKAHEALDGKEVEGSNVRVSFANPSKSAQSYKSRFGNQGLTAGVSGRGFPVVPAMMGAAIRGHMAMPLLAPRFLGARPCMLGMGLGMQFGGGAPVGPGMIGRGLVSPLLSGGAGMLGPGSIAGMMGRGPGLLLGPVPIPSAAIAQVATAQAKAREEEAKARAEFRRLQEVAQHSQIAPVNIQSGQNYYQDVQYPYQQAYQQTGQQSSIPVPQQQQPQHHGGQQGHQSYASTYYSQTGQQHHIQQQQQQQAPPPLPQQQQHHQPAYYHQQTQPSPQTSNTAQQQQYNQYAQQYSQQPYGSQTATQQYGQQQQPNTSSQVTQRTQQEYADLYAQQLQQQQEQQQQLQVQQQQQQQQQQQKQKQQQQQHHNQQRQYQQRHQHQQHHQEAAVAASTSNVSAYAPDIVQPLPYASYYQQRATAIPGTQTSSPVAQQQQSLEAQWAAYYAAQQAAHQTEAINNSYHEQGSYSQQSHQNSAVTVASAYYQQPTGSDVGQKRSADQMEYGSQTMQSAYTYNQQAGMNAATYQHHAAASDTVYQHQNSSTGSSFQQAAMPAVYQHQHQNLPAGYQQNSDAVVYQQPADAAVYQQPADAGVYQQQPSSSYHHQQPAGTYHQSHQGATVSAAVYEYSKRPRY